MKRAVGESDYALRERLRSIFKTVTALTIQVVAVRDIDHPAIEQVRRVPLAVGDTLCLKKQFFLDEDPCGIEEDIWRIVRGGTFETALAAHVETKRTGVTQ